VVVHGKKSISRTLHWNDKWDLKPLKETRRATLKNSGQRLVLSKNLKEQSLVHSLNRLLLDNVGKNTKVMKQRG